MTRFDDLGLSPKALEAVRALGYTQPTPVQEQTIPLVLEGRDVIAGAQTGTGKTAAFCLPTLARLRHAAKHCGPLMLVVTPTRELADQIGEVCETITRHTKHRITTVVGGVSYNPQKEALKRGTDVLIATPGRLEDLLGQDAVSLDQVEVLVLDEADRMVDMGFLPSVRRIVKRCTLPHQTLLFSATIDDAVQEFAAEALSNPAQVEIAHRGETADTVDQYIVRIAHAAKPSALKAILDEHGANRVIVFARTRHRADACARRLNRAGYKTEALHSDKSQNQRRRALEGFHKGKVNVLVATDVLARGIDISQVDYVVNFDLPSQPEDYIHRIGRTGRAGESGFSISLVSPETEDALRDIEELTHQRIPEMRLTTLDVAAAEAEAETRSLQLKARREKDPEVEAVILELAAKDRAKKKAAARAEAEAQGAGKEKATKGGSRKRSKGKREKGGETAEQPIGAKPMLSLEAASSPSAAPKKSPAKKAAGKSTAGKSAARKPASGKSAAGKPSASKPRTASASPKNVALSVRKKPKGAAAPKAAASNMRPGRAHRAELAKKRR